jgi:hypothetical protein
MNPITYPARPLNGGRLEQAPAKDGEWLVEPKYNGWRALVHAPSGTMFNRYGERLSIEGEFTRALAMLKEGPFEWLDCEALERRHRIGRGTLLVFDYVHGQLPLQRRKALLAEAYPLHAVEHKPQDQSIYAVQARSCGEIEPLEFYRQLQGFNTRWGCVFYEGLVFKRAELGYPVQLRSTGKEFAGWVKHRWI